MMIQVHVLTGFHLIEIRATDANSNKELTPVAYEWVVY
jgi:hypothetical protein